MRWLLPRLVTVLGLIMAAPALAQQAAVGRISLVEGHVNFHPPGNTAGWGAEINDPVFAGSVVATEPQARAEIRVGPDAVDLAPGTIVDFARLDAHGIDLALKQGRVGVRLRRADKGGDVEIDAARGGVWLQRPGSYDIDAGDAQQPARVRAISGSARFVGGGADVTVADGREATLSGDKDHVTATVGAAVADAFAQWCQTRGEGFEQHPAALYFVSPAMTGYDALDQAGVWEGGVWYPRALPADGRPYRFGRWRRIAPWGWTWIDDQAWGFAPSHYGRWSDIGHRWGWVPGNYAADPAYAPALVAFLGTPGVGLSLADASAPGIGWFPLAPGEVYWPSYSAALGYIRRLNRPNVADVGVIRLAANGELPREVFDQHFADREFASVVPRAVFVGGGAVAAALVQLPEQRLLDAPVLMGSPQIQIAAAAPKPATPAVAKPAPAAAKEVAVLHGGRTKPPMRTAVRLVRLAGGHVAAMHFRAPAFVAATATARRSHLATAVLRGRPARPPPLRLAHYAHFRQLRH
jgi:hypothetical protein